MDELIEREAFEWATAHMGLDYEEAGLYRKSTGCAYWHTATEAAWCAWKSTRTLVSEGPPLSKGRTGKIPSYGELETTIRLIHHATAPTHDDGAYHEAAYGLADKMITRIDKSRE